MKLNPILKYTGTKSIIAENIISHFPANIDTMYEPFSGSAAVSCRMMHDNHKVNKYVISDINSDVIDYFNCIKNNSDEIKLGYEELWNRINSKNDKKAEYYIIRDEFNNMESSIYKTCLFTILNRTCINGLIRYNKKGDFTSGYHYNRNGMIPTNFFKLVDLYSCMFNNNDVDFICQSYKNISPNIEDYVFMDPPYITSGSIYINDINQNEYFDFIRKLKSRYSFTYDGLKNGNVVHDITENVFTSKVVLPSTKGSFSFTGNNNNMINEYLYIKDIL